MMTPQERQLLESLANRVASTNLGPKDPEADALIQQKIGAMPDALYVLTQTVLIQEMALNQANNRLHDLQQQIDTHRGEQNQPTSFLGRLFGTGNAPRPSAPPPYQQPPYQPPPPMYPPQYDAPQYQPIPGQAPSFLRSAAMTATGVAAGALAFEGIESLFGHHGGFGGNAFGGGGEFLGGGPSETVVNNYYDDSSASGDPDRFADTERADFQQSDASSDSGPESSPDIDNTSFDDNSGSFDTSGDDFSSTDV